MVVQTAERAGDVSTLSLLDLEHEFADIGRYRIHPQGVEATLKHVGLDAGLVERGRPLADRNIRVLPVEEVHLLESSAVGLHTVEASHIDDGRSHPDKLVHTGLVFARGLPHVPIYKGKLYLFSHNVCTI